MLRKMSATEARVHFGEVLRAVSESGDHIEVERGGQPIAVVISIEEYRALRESSHAEPELDWYDQIKATHHLFKHLGHIDWAEEIRAGRDERERQIDDALARR